MEGNGLEIRYGDWIDLLEVIRTAESALEEKYAEIFDLAYEEDKLALPEGVKRGIVRRVVDGAARAMKTLKEKEQEGIIQLVDIPEGLSIEAFESIVRKMDTGQTDRTHGAAGEKTNGQRDHEQTHRDRGRLLPDASDKGPG